MPMCMDERIFSQNKEFVMDTIGTPKASWQMRVYPIFTLLGWALVLFSLTVGVVVLSATAAEYWGSNAKAVRDAAGVGSELLGQLRVLAMTPNWLEPLTFLGVASFMLGIALEFSSIPSLLENRGDVLKVCFPLIVRQQPARD